MQAPVLPSHRRGVDPRRVDAADTARGPSLGAGSSVRMIPGKIDVDGRQLRFAVSDNEDVPGPDGPGSEPVWAVNLHGYFAGGGMYWRESSQLAQTFGWRVLNPSLPGFAGSDPLPWEHVNVHAMTEQVASLLDQLRIERALLLGHSMGGAL